MFISQPAIETKLPDLAAEHISIDRNQFEISDVQAIQRLVDLARDIQARREFQTYHVETKIADKPGSAQARAVIVERESYYFVNGMETISIDQKIENRMLSETFNAKYTLQPNPEENMLIDITKGACGLVSNRIGCYLEGDVAEPLRKKIIADLNLGATIHIACHSQGTIIIHNTLGEIYRNSEPAWWKAHAKQIHIRYFASSIKDWSPGVNVQGYEQEGDHVAKLIGRFSKCVTWAKATLGREYTQAKIIKIKGGGHDFESYIKNQPHFYVQDFIERNKGTLDGQKLATEVSASIHSTKRAYGTQTYSELLNFCVNVGGKEFCTKIKSDIKETEDGYFIGDIKISKSTYEAINKH